MQMKSKLLVTTALLLACAGLSTVPTHAVQAQSAPPRPTVTTQVEPGMVPLEKINARVKDPAKRKKFEKNDREKYGLASNEGRERGHINRKGRTPNLAK